MAASLAPRAARSAGGTSGGRRRPGGPRPCRVACAAIPASQSTASAGRSVAEAAPRLRARPIPCPASSAARRRPVSAAKCGRAADERRRAGRRGRRRGRTARRRASKIAGARSSPPRAGEEQQKLGVEDALVEAQAQRRVVGVCLLGAVGEVERGLGHAATGARRRATRARSSGTSSASNQGLRFSQPVLRHDGCGSGRTPGGQSRQSRDRLGHRAGAAAEVPALGVAADQQRQADRRHGGERAGRARCAAQSGGGGRSEPSAS